jgi:hypothetical protein
MNEIRRDYWTLVLANRAHWIVTACILAAFALGMLLGGVLF